MRAIPLTCIINTNTQTERLLMTKNLLSISSTHSSPQLYESPFVIEENRVYYSWLGDGGRLGRFNRTYRWLALGPANLRVLEGWGVSRGMRGERDKAEKR